MHANRDIRFMMMQLVIMTVFFLAFHIEASLHVGYYEKNCPYAEAMIKDEVTQAFSNDPGISPGLLRMHFHDCFVRGCDASVLIDSTPDNVAEKDGLPNRNSLRGFEVVDNIKAKLEAACPGVVSCADILAFSARDAVLLTGGLYWEVAAGRRDGRISRASKTSDFPSPTFNLQQSVESFAKKGLTHQDMVALLGAHTIGRSHCRFISTRLYNYSHTMSQDPELNPVLAHYLKLKCPREDDDDDEDAVVYMNQTPFVMDTSYYADVSQNAGLFTSDLALSKSPQTAFQAAFYAAHFSAWQAHFASAMIKMSQIQVLTGDEGEIRAYCRVVNHD